MEKKRKEKKRKCPIHIRIGDVPSIKEMKGIARSVKVELIIEELDSLVENMHSCANKMKSIIDFDGIAKDKIKELRGAAKIVSKWKDELNKKLKEEK